MPPSKSQLRARYLDTRRALSPTQYEPWNQRIQANLIHFLHRYPNQPVLTYLASKDNEVDTLIIARDLLAADRQIFVPVAERGGALTWFELQNLDALQRSEFGILEPSPDSHERVTPPDQSVALVPGIAFTRTGHRLGYGFGYYDRFLSNYRGASIGLAYECQLAPELPTGTHDVPVHFVITEDAIYDAATGRRLETREN